MMRLQDQHVLILGLGQSGLAMARWCARRGARVTLADTRAQPPQLQALRAQLPTANFIHGQLDARLIEGRDIRLVLRSPGLSPAQLAPVLEAARAAGLWVGGELSLFAAALAELADSQAYRPQVLAVTGTNGKTTVTRLTAELVARTGKPVAIAGNIGPTLLDTLQQHLDQASLPQVWVLELSSFQLDAVQDFEPTAAALLNLSQDHLDWHGDMAAYGAAKARIAGPATLRVLNRDDPQTLALLAPAVTAAGPGRGGEKARTPWLSFGTDLPTRPGDYGLEQVNGMTWLVRAQEADETHKRRRSAEDEALFIQRLMPADALRIHGRHNACNALAALALAQAAGCALAPMLYGLRAYRGEPHRVESVGVVQGVEYFDDSKGTNVGATVAALQGLGSDRKLVLILGGEGKGQDFSPLADPVARYARAVVLIGRDAALIRAALHGCGVPLLAAAQMQDAVQQAAASAQPGDAVLMSPACASFDMFDDYQHRAQVFVQAVQSLAHEAGVEVGGLA